MMRKPHNLITEYWSDLEYLLKESEHVETTRDHSHPVYEKRSMRHAILSAFLFLEAFINAEYFSQLNLADSITSLNPTQIKTLETLIVKTTFEDKWSIWIANFMKVNKPNLQNEIQFKNLKKLKLWRNMLTHYKLHDLMEVAHDIQNIATVKEAYSITRNAVIWYYGKTGFDVPEWITETIIKSKI